MKKTTLFLALSYLTVGTSFAKENVFCGSTNQWSTEEKSGWYLEIDYTNKGAFVIRAESPSVARQFGYSIERINDKGMNLSSEFGHTLSLVETSASSYVGYSTSDVGQKETFEVKCFKSSAIGALKPKKLKINKDLAVASELKKALQKLNYNAHLTFTLDEKENVPFSLIARKIQHSISEIGDWEDSILSPEQERKVYKALEGDEGFQKLAASLKEDAKKDPKAKQLGLLFGRDWYYSAGKVAFVMLYEGQIIVLPHEYAGNTQFGDARLDYVY